MINTISIHLYLFFKITFLVDQGKEIDQQYNHIQNEVQKAQETCSNLNYLLYQKGKNKPYFESGYSEISEKETAQTAAHSRMRTSLENNDIRLNRLSDFSFAISQLHEAILNGEWDDVESILSSKKFDLQNLLDSPGQNGWNALHLSAFYCSEEDEIGRAILKTILNSVNQWREIITPCGYTVLMLASQKENIETMRYLVKKVDVNFLTQKGTALHVACQEGQVKATRFLLAKTAIQTELKNSDDKIAAEVATQEVKEFLNQNDNLLKMIKSNTIRGKASLVEESPEKPSMVRGSVQLNMFAFVKSERILEINPDLCSLIFYESPKHVPKKPKDIIPMKDISKIEEWKGTVMMSSSLNYIRIYYGADVIVIGFKFQSTRQLWLHHLQIALEYCKFVETKLMSYINLQENKKLTRSFLFLSILAEEFAVIELEDKKRVTDQLGKNQNKQKKNSFTKPSKSNKSSFSSKQITQSPMKKEKAVQNKYSQYEQDRSTAYDSPQLQENINYQNLQKIQSKQQQTNQSKTNELSKENNLKNALTEQNNYERCNVDQINSIANCENDKDKNSSHHNSWQSFSNMNSYSSSHHPSNPFIFNQDSSQNIQCKDSPEEIVWLQKNKKIVIKEDNFVSNSTSLNYFHQNNTPLSLKSFNILDVLGSGSFGRVFLAQIKGQQGSNSLYALKAIKKNTLISKNQLKYAKRELNILKKCSHPFIVHLKSSFQSLNYLFFALEYCAGGDLGGILAFKNSMKEETVRFISSQIILALEYLHSIKVVYRDMKPENILIDSEGYIKITDFGLSRESVHENELLRSFCGSPAYISPEILRREGASKKTDIYGIGCVMYEMLTGNPPFMSSDINQLYELIKNQPVNFNHENISPIAKDLLEKMLSKGKDERIGLQEIKKHEFFKSMNWKKLENKEVKAEEEILQCLESANSISFFQNSGEKIFKDTEFDESNDPGKLKIDNWSFCSSK